MSTTPDLLAAISSGMFGGLTGITNPIVMLFLTITIGYAVIKMFFANLKRGGILLIEIAVGSLYMFSLPRGYIDGFVQWGKQIIGLCLTTFLQATILTAGLMVLRDHALLGLGLMLSAGEVPRIAERNLFMKLIYVASPYAGDTLKNTEFAKKACRHVMEQGSGFVIGKERRTVPVETLAMTMAVGMV